MYRFKAPSLLSFMLLFCVALPVWAVDTPPDVPPAQGAVTLQLAPKLQALLTEEMIAISAASTKILNALVAGDHGTVAKQAQAIHDSFILEKKLTKQDREAFEKALSPDFVKMDTQFHAKAERLADVARRRDIALEHYYFSRLIDTCQACHRRFATKKFPGLTGAGTDKNGYGHAENVLLNEQN